MPIAFARQDDRKGTPFIIGSRWEEKTNILQFPHPHNISNTYSSTYMYMYIETSCAAFGNPEFFFGCEKEPLTNLL